MQTTTSISKPEKKSKPVLNKLFHLLMRQTDADKRIALFGCDPLRTK